MIESTAADFTAPQQDCQQETPVLEFIFRKVADLQACNIIKKRPQHRCFPVNIAKLLILPILKTICKQLLFNFFSVVHSYMDLPASPNLYLKTSDKFL